MPKSSAVSSVSGSPSDGQRSNRSSSTSLNNQIVIPKNSNQRESPISSYLNGAVNLPPSPTTTSHIQNSVTDSRRRASIARLAGSPMSTPLGASFQDGRGRSLLRSSFLRNSRPGSFTTTSASRPNMTPSLRETESLFESDQSSSLSFGINNDDPNMTKMLSKHLVNSDDPLQLQGGDITRDLYRLESPLRRNLRRKSISSTDIDHIRKYSMASSINVPGGFRREFIVRKNVEDQKKFGYKLSEPNFLTRNFIEFLTVYGHFAGEDLEDEDYMACDLVNPLENGSIDEETPLLASMHRRKGTLSVAKSFFILLKGFVGTGILFLPKLFGNGGLLFSILTLLFFGLLSYWCYLILIYSKQLTKVQSFGEIGAQLYGEWMKKLILFSIVLTQIGFVAAYIVFTCENLRAFVSNIFALDIPLNILVMIQVIIFIPLSMIRNITRLSFAAVLANFFILFGLCVIVYFTTLKLITEGVGQNIVMYNSDSWSLFIGVAIFAFEGIGLIIPVEEAMLEPEKFPLVLFLVIACCSTLFILTGTLGYTLFGDQVKTVIILNLPQESLLVNSIQFFYALAILLSAPLQLFPLIKIIENKIFTKSGKHDLQIKWRKNIVRSLIVILTGITAYYGSDNLDKFVSFVGCFACIPLVYMYPPMLHYKSVAKGNPMMQLSDLILILLGAIAMIYTSYQIIIG